MMGFGSLERMLALLVVLAFGWVGCAEEPAVAEQAGPAALASHRAPQRVRVAEVTRGSLGALSGVSGITSALRHATVSAEVAARIVERHVEPGATVAAGAPLVTLDGTHLSIAVDEAQAMLQARKVDVAEARSELERGDELGRKGAISNGRLDDLRFAEKRANSARDLADAALRRAQRAHADAIVRAPFDGTVEQIDVQVGDYLAPGAPVATLADFSRVRIRAGVTAAEAARLEVGVRATVSLPALGGFEAETVIHSVGLMADPASGTYPVELWVDNPQQRLRGGMVAQVRLASQENEDRALAPRLAVLRRQGRLAVYVVEERDGELRAFVREVRVGRQQGDSVELIEGPPAGARVVTEGLFALTDGAVVFVDGSPGS